MFDEFTDIELTDGIGEMTNDNTIIDNRMVSCDAVQPTFCGRNQVELETRYQNIDHLYRSDIDRAIDNEDYKEVNRLLDARDEAYGRARVDQAKKDYYDTVSRLYSIQNTTSIFDNTTSFLGNVHHDAEINGHILDETAGDDSILHPVNEQVMTNLLHRWEEPLGRYAMEHFPHHDYGEVEMYQQLSLPVDFNQQELQQICNGICDVLHWKHIPATITDAYWNPNAAYTPGLFTHLTFDDRLFLNPNYANSCINEIGNTEIVISDMAHEIGHSIATNICGNKGTYLDEKMADFISGFADAKLGVNIDVARKWFEWQFDNQGLGGYPISEDRWDAQAAGYYFAHWANGDDLQQALKDSSFVEIIRAYKNEV